MHHSKRGLCYVRGGHGGLSHGQANGEFHNIDTKNGWGQLPSAPALLTTIEFPEHTWLLYPPELWTQQPIFSSWSLILLFLLFSSSQDQAKASTRKVSLTTTPFTLTCFVPVYSCGAASRPIHSFVHACMHACVHSSTVLFMYSTDMYWATTKCQILY